MTIIAQSSAIEVDLFNVLVFLVVLVVTVAVTFYLKDFLQKRMEYGALRKKLATISGKGSTIIYLPGNHQLLGPKGQLFKIEDIDNRGVTLKNELETVFVPAAKLVKSEMIIPSDDFDEIRQKLANQEMERMMDGIMDPMFNKMFPAMFDAIEERLVDRLGESEGEFSAAIMFKFTRFLKDEGLEIKKLPKD